MKKINTLIIVLTMIGSIQIMGAVPTLPIHGVDEIRNYAMSIATSGSRAVYADSMDWGLPGTITYTNVSGSFGEDILGQLFEVEFLYRLTNPDDLIKGFTYLYDKNDTLLFYGYTEYTTESLTASKPQYTLWMQNIPMGENIDSAEVLALDTEGRTAQRYPLEVNKWGQMLFQPWMANSANGILVVRFNDGTLATYKLDDPQGGALNELNENATYKVDGHYIYRCDVATEKPVTIKIVEMWNLPSVFIEVSVAQYITFDVAGIVQVEASAVLERPASMQVIRDDQSGEQVDLLTDAPSTILLEPGIYRIRFDWVNFGKPGLLYTGPTPVGGKG